MYKFLTVIAASLIGSPLAAQVTPPGLPPGQETAPPVPDRRAGGDVLNCVPGKDTSGRKGTVRKSRRVQINPNTATCTELLQLVGVDVATARRWVASRPYTFPNDLVTKGILTEAQLQQVAPQLTFIGASSPRQPEVTSQPRP